ncbi:hypothetical protein [Candidatus Tisiphia endosymbiont of Sialis lutaria]|uniref:hypothetical protein n=1 Tax=Candidatus Tisiphia endosymbiont of Sialis lutaria TaxID=2029164 RepID=UPI00312C7A30
MPLEKFKSDIADIVGESKEGFVEEVNRLKSLLNFSFDSRYGSELAKAVKKMGIEQETVIQVSLDDDTTNVLSPTEKDIGQNFGEFKGNIGTTLNSHGELAKGYAAEYDQGQPHLDKFGQQAKKMNVLIDELPHNSLQEATEQIETIATIEAGTNKIYSKLQSSPNDLKHTIHPEHIVTINKLGAGLRKYIESFVKSPEEQKEAFMQNGVETIQAIDKANKTDGLQNSKTALEKILSKFHSTETVGSKLYHRLIKVLKKDDISVCNTIKPDTTPYNTKHSNKDKGR